MEGRIWLGTRARGGGGVPRRHDRLFGFSIDYMPVELLAARLSAVGRTEPVPLPELSGEGAGLEAARVGERPAWSASARELVPARP